MLQDSRTWKGLSCLTESSGSGVEEGLARNSVRICCIHIRLKGAAWSQVSQVLQKLLFGCREETNMTVISKEKTKQELFVMS